MRHRTLSLILFLLLVAPAWPQTAFGQHRAPGNDPSAVPINKVRKIYIAPELGTSQPLLGMKPKGKLKKKLAKELAGTCLEIVENLSEADAALEVDLRDKPDDGITNCVSDFFGTTCSGGGVHAAYGPGGGYSMSGPSMVQELVLRDPKEWREIRGWRMFDYRIELAGPSRLPKDLAKSLLDAVGCGGSAHLPE